MEVLCCELYTLGDFGEIWAIYVRWLFYTWEIANNTCLSNDSAEQIVTVRFARPK